MCKDQRGKTKLTSAVLAFLMGLSAGTSAVSAWSSSEESLMAEVMKRIDAKYVQNGSNIVILGNAAQSDNISLGRDSYARASAGIAIGRETQSGLNSITMGRMARAAYSRPGNAGWEGATVTYTLGGDPNNPVFNKNAVAIGTNSLAGASNIASTIPRDENTYLDSASIANLAGQVVYYRTQMTKIKDANQKGISDRYYGQGDIATAAKGDGNLKLYDVVRDSGTDQVAVGTHSRAIGDQSIAIGSNSMAGRYSIVMGGNSFGDKNDAESFYKMYLDNGGIFRTLSGYRWIDSNPKNEIEGSTYAGEASVAIGTKAHTMSPMGTAVGAMARIEPNSFGAVALGAGSSVGTQSSGHESIGAVAIGMGSVAKGIGTIALGSRAVVWSKKGDVHRITAIGYGTTANNADSVALGSLAEADRGSDMAGYFYGYKAATIDKSKEAGSIELKLKDGAQDLIENYEVKVTPSAWEVPTATETDIVKGFRTHVYEGLKGPALKANAGALSIGKKGSTPNAADAITRQIVNVAAGTNDTDAVNVAQLRNVNMMVEADAAAAGTPKPFTDFLLDNSRLKISGQSYLSTELSQDKEGPRITLKAKTTELVSNQDGTYTTKNNEDGLITGGELVKGMNEAKQARDKLEKKLSDLTYLNENGEPLVKGDDGKFYKPKADGTPDTKAGEQKPAGVRLGEKDKPMQLTNVAPAAKEITAEGPTKGLADLANAKDNTVATVADLKKLGFVVSAGDNYSEKVQHAQEVNFKGEGLAEVSGKTEGQKRVITVKVDDKKVADAVKSINDKAGNAPTQYVDKDGNPLVKAKDGKYYPKDKVGDDGTPKPNAQAVEPASIQVGEKGKPTQLTNVKPGTEAITTNGPTKGLADFTNAKPGTVATIDDLQRLGFVVADGASYHDTVTNAQTVKFVGDGLATVTGETKNNIRTFTVKVDKEEVAKAINAEGAKKGTAPTTYVDENGNPLVKGDDGKYYKPKADGTPDTTAGEQTPAGVRLGEKGKPIQLTNVAPAAKDITTEGPTKGLADLANAKDGTVATVADLKKLGFVVSAGDNYSEKVQHAQEVNFKGEGLAEVSGKTEGQKRIITVKVDDKKVADAVKTINDKAGNAPIQYVDKDGNPLVKAKDGNYYPKDKVGDDGTPKPNAKSVEPASIQVGEKGKPTQLTNVKPGTNDIKDEGPTKGLADLKNAVPGTVATVDDLKKLGFVIKGKASDGTTDVVAQVKHADTVEFAGEDLAKVVTESKDGVSKVTVKVNKEEIAKAVNAENAKKGSTPTTYVDKDGNPLVKDGDKYYKPKADGTPDTTAGEQTPAGVRLGEKDKPIQLTNVAPATKAIDKANDPTNGLADLAKAKDGTVATVADLKKLGFVVSAGDNYSEKVQNAQEVNFKGEGLAEVSGKTEGQKRIITVKVDDKKVADAVKTINDKAGNAPTQYVDKDGNPLVKAKDGNYYPKDKVGDDGQPKPDAQAVEPASIQVGEKGKPTQLTNVKPGTNDITAEGPTKGLADLKNAVPGTVATVDDLKKLGFVIKGKASDGTTDVVAQVKHADTVEFAGEDLAKVVTESKDGVSKVTVKVNKEDIAKAVNAENAKKGSTPTTYVDKDGNPLVKGDDGKYYKAKADGTPDTTAGEQTPAGVRLGEKDKPIQLTNVAPATEAINKANDPTNGLADLASAKDGTVATVADLKKVGFVVADGSNYHETVTNAQTVKFVGEGLAEVSGKTEDNVRTFTVKVDDKKVADAVKTINDKAGNAPTQYVDKDGNPLVKAKDGKYYPKDKVGDDGQPTQGAQAVEPAGIQVGEKDKPTQIMNVAPATKAIDKPNDPTNGLADLANAKDGTVATVDDLKKLGFVIKGKAADGTTDVTGQVKHANTVEFAGEDLAKVVTESANGASKVTVKVNKEDIVKVVNDANDKKGSAPTQYVDKDGNPLVKDGDKYYKAKNDGTPDKDAGEKTPAGIKVGEKDKPMQLDNVGRGTETKPVNGKDGQPIMGSDNQPLQLVDLKDAKDTKVATVGDLKDMGFVLGASVNAAGGHKAYQDVVKNGNKVRFEGLGGAWISGKTAADGTRVITIDVNADNLVTGTQNAIQYVDGQGNRMIPMLQKGKEVLYYNAADNPVKHKTPTGEDAVYKASDIIDEAGTLKPGATPLQGKKAGDVSGLGVALVHPNGSADTKEGTVLRNVGVGTETIAAPTDDKDIVGKAKAGLADLDKSKDTNGLSVADAKKLGWVISTGKDGKNFAEKVKTADEVNFQGEENGPITVTGSADGSKRIVTIGVDAQKMAAVVKSELDKSGDSNVQYVDKDGKPLVKVGDKYYTKDQLQDNGQPKDDAKDSKPAAQKLAGTEPMQLKNVAPGTKSIEAPKEADAKLADKAKAGLADLSVQEDKDKDKDVKNTAATVDDLRRMGWILSTEDDYADKVQNADEINLKGVDGITITGKTDGTKRIVSVGVDAQAVIEHADIPVVYKDQHNKPLTKVGNDFYEKPENSNDAPVFVPGENGQKGAVYKKSDLGNDGKPKAEAKPLTPVDKGTMKASLNGDKPMVLSNVAAGSAPTDAVNKEQMDSAVAAMAKAVGNAQDEVRGVGADAAALAGLKPLQYDPIEPTQIMAALGNYDNKTALALGVAHYTNESTMLNAGVSLGGKHRMVNVGYTKKFGHSSAERAIPDRYKAGPISSVYVMQDEVTMLKAENEQQKNELQNQKREIQELRDIVKALLAKK